MRIFWFLLACAGLLTLPRGAVADTIYVDNVLGDDLHEGTEPDSSGRDGPVRTLDKALRISNPGDHIVLAATGEPYRESIGLSAAQHCGNAISPFIIDGQGAILEGADPVPYAAWENFAGPVFRFRPTRTSYQHLFLDGKPAVERKILPGETRLPELEPLEWYRRGAYIYFRVDPDKLPRDYNLSCSARQTGITLYHVHDVVVMNLVVQGFRLDGLNVNDGVTRCEVLDITSRGNGRSGITVAGSSKARIEGCLVGDNGEQQLLVEGPSTTLVEQCDLLANTAPAVTNRGARLTIRAGETSAK
jgi:hypothetical protein